jgi:pyruvate formate lyase activating enzyme
MIKRAELFERLDAGRVKCTSCARYCRLSPNQIGFCGMRQNIGGKLFLLTYGTVLACHIDPIEKKPVTHYQPGTRIFSIGTSGCNFMCKYCINYDLSQRRQVAGRDVLPKELALLAQSQDCQGIAYTYNEPTIFLEFARDVGLEAKKRGLFNIFVSNGYGTPEAVKTMREFLDCITVDFKGNGDGVFLRKYTGIPNVEPIYETLLEIKNKTNIHIEITDLVVPSVGDDLGHARKLSKWIYDNLGPDIPIHFLRFFPGYKMLDFPETPVETLEQHWQVAKEEGLNYVYVGNVVGHKLEHTYCPDCNRIVVERFGTDITGWHLTKANRCEYCQAKIAIEGNLSYAAHEDRYLPAYF